MRIVKQNLKLEKLIRGKLKGSFLAMELTREDQLRDTSAHFLINEGTKSIKREKKTLKPAMMP